MTDYVSRDGDMLDAVCYQFYGDESAVVNVLDKNPGLVNYPAILPAGIRISLPDITIADSPSVTLWD